MLILYTFSHDLDKIADSTERAGRIQQWYELLIDCSGGTSGGIGMFIYDEISKICVLSTVAKSSIQMLLNEIKSRLHETLQEYYQ